MVQSETHRRQASRLVSTLAILAFALAAYGAVAVNTLRNGRIDFDEVSYLVKSWAYVSGTVAPYTASDATWYMPFYFYQLGWWQNLTGLGIASARALSIALGLVSGGLLFAIARRLTGNVLAAAAAVLIYLATPTTAFIFATATPSATVAALHLALVWLVVASLGRPQVWITIVFGILCAAAFFYRQDMILAVAVLAPLYVAAIGSKRLNHALLLAAAIAVTTAAVLRAFPPLLGAYALRLPAITPWLEHAGLLPADFTLIDEGTVNGTSMGLALTHLTLANVVNTFLLPFAGTIILAAGLFLVAGKNLRVLWLAPLYFFYLAGAHVVGTAGCCSGNVMAYASSFVAIGALAAALTLAALASIARRQNMSAAAVIIIGAVMAAALNVFAPALATTAELQYFPAPRLTPSRPLSEQAEIDSFARWIAVSTPRGEPILLLHDLPALPYAVFTAAHMFPPQSIDPSAARRTLRPGLSPTVREAVQAAVEAQSLWTDETLNRWLQRDYDLVLLQENKNVDQSALKAALAQNFDLIGASPFRGWNISLYKRKSVQ